MGMVDSVAARHAAKAAGQQPIVIAVTVDGDEVWSLEGTPAVIWLCVECGEMVNPAEAEDDRLYECATDNGCGAIFRRSNGQGRAGTLCPDCGKFGSKLGEGKVCPLCEVHFIEEGEEPGYQCSGCDETLLGRDEFLDHARDEHMAGAL